MHHQVEVVAADFDELDEGEARRLRHALEREVVLVEEEVKVFEREQESAASDVGIEEGQLVAGSAAEA